MAEPRDIRLRRLTMRSMRRGIREMDLILTAYAAKHLKNLDNAGLDLYEVLLEEADQDLYLWITGRAQAPERLRAMVREVSEVFQNSG